MLNNGQGFAGLLGLESFGSGYNAQAFLVQSILSKVSTATICKVVGVTNSGGVSGSGFVDVQPLVNMVDGLGNAFPHGVIYHCAYNRVQGGTNAIILDPQVGDVGLVVFADRDISSAVKNRAQSNPGSGRKFDMADGLYVFSIVTAPPTQYIRFTPAGIDITSPVAVTVNAPSVTVNAPTAVIRGDNVTVHAAVSYGQDVNGYGTRTTWTGGTNYTIDSYTTGATVTANSHPINPPQIP